MFLYSNPLNFACSYCFILLHHQSWLMMFVIYPHYTTHTSVLYTIFCFALVYVFSKAGWNKAFTYIYIYTEKKDWTTFDVFIKLKILIVIFWILLLCVPVDVTKVSEKFTVYIIRLQISTAGIWLHMKRGASKPSGRGKLVNKS
jgi:hypothetical protein